MTIKNLYNKIITGGTLINEEKLINKYLSVLKKVNSIIARIRATGNFDKDQLDQITITLTQELPELVFNEEQLNVIKESKMLHNIAFYDNNDKYR